MTQQPGVGSRRVPQVLRPVSAGDYDEIYRWSTHPSTGLLWRYRGATPSPELVIRQIWDGATAVYAVTLPGRRPAVGVVGLYNYSNVSRYCYLFALSAPEARGAGAVALGALLLCEQAFTTFRVRKVYVEATQSSLVQYASAVSRGLLEEEARLVEHEWNGVGYDDLVTLSVTRERWDRLAPAGVRVAGLSV